LNDKLELQQVVNILLQLRCGFSHLNEILTKSYFIALNRNDNKMGCFLPFASMLFIFFNPNFI